MQAELNAVSDMLSRLLHCFVEIRGSGHVLSQFTDARLVVPVQSSLTKSSVLALEVVTEPLCVLGQLRVGLSCIKSSGAETERVANVVTCIQFFLTQVKKSCGLQPLE